MESCGPYRIVREIGARRDATVYLARAGEEDVALVVFATALDPNPDAAAARAEAIIDTQKRAAASSLAVAQIIASGRCDEGVWYATKFYPRPLQKLVQGRVALNRDWIHRIISRIVDGALALKRASGRSHGDLKLSNILISGSSEVDEAEIVVTEPLSDDSDPARIERDDLKAVGLVLYQLVRRREAELDSLILPIEFSPEWKSVLGRDAQAWLKLCNALLTGEARSLESVHDTVAALEPKPPISKATLAIAAVVVLVLGIAGLFALRAMNRGHIQVSSNVPGASIAILRDGKVVQRGIAGPQPFRVRLARGQYVVAASFKDLIPRTNTVALEAGQTAAVDILFEFGTVLVTSEPAGAAFDLPDGTRQRTPYTYQFVKPGEVRLELSLDGHAPADTVGAVKAGETNILTATLSPRQPGDQLVEFTSSPSGARVSDSQGRLNATTKARRDLPPGAHTITARYSYWPPIQTNIIVQSETNLHIHFPHGTATFACVPESTLVFVGTNQVASGTAEAFLPAGRLELRFEAPGYEGQTISTNVQDQAGLRFQVTLKAKHGFVDFSSDPPGAVIYDASNTEIARTDSPQMRPLPPGQYTFTARVDGLEPVTRTISVEYARTNQAAFAFKYGRVQFASQPPNAEIYIPLKQRWERVEQVALLPEGTHPIAARWLVYGVTNRSAPLAVTAAHKLQPLAHTFRFDYGSLILTSAPPELNVLLNGKFVHVTPYTNPIVPVGTVTYQLVSTNGRRDVTVNILPGTTVIDGWNFLGPPIHINSIGMELVWIEAGSFWVGKHEVTQADYMKVTGLANPSQFTNNLRNPVEFVTPQEALQFCQRLDELDRTAGRSPRNAANYTLPAFTQWPLYLGGARLEDSVTSFGRRANPLQRPEPVGSRAPNALGLYDVRGNVWEWCLGSNNTAVARGGSFADASETGVVNTLSTNYITPAKTLTTRVPYHGFRVILPAVPSTARR